MNHYKMVIYRHIAFLFIALTIFSVSFYYQEVNFLISTEQYKKFTIFFDKFFISNLKQEYRGTLPSSSKFEEEPGKWCLQSSK